MDDATLNQVSHVPALATLNQVGAGSRPWRAREAAPADGRLLRGPDPAHQLRDQALPKPAGGEDQIRSLQGASYESVPHTSLCLIRVCAVHQSSLDVPCAPNKLELYARQTQAQTSCSGDSRGHEIESSPCQIERGGGGGRILAGGRTPRSRIIAARAPFLRYASIIAPI